MLAVLLYGAEAWSIKARELKRLSSFHNHCVRSMMGVSKYQQWKGHISSRYLASAAGMEEQMSEILMKHRLRWPGHLARMDPYRLPKQLLFGEFVRRRPCHGVKRRWRDDAAADVKAIDVGDDWYSIAQDRKAWRAVCGDGLSALVDSTGLVFVLPIYLHAHLLGLQPIPALVDGSFIGKETVQDTAASALPL